MAFEYISPDGLVDAYESSKRFMKPLCEPFDEFERIARNKPHPGTEGHLPKITDGTLASLIQEQPKRVIQQIPTGKVKSDDEWLNIVGGYIYEHEIITYADYQAALIQKSWAAVSKALTYGSQPAYVQFLNRGDRYSTDFSLPYIRDVLLEPGKLSDRDSNIIMMRSWYLPNQIDAILSKEKMLSGKAKDRGEKYEEGWNTKRLQEAKAKLSAKDADAQTPTERSKSNEAGYIEVIHCFQRGVGAKFYSFIPSLGSDNLVRTRVNPDPRGMIPIHYLYANIDLSNPLGRGSVEISGGMQNLLDSEVQMYQFTRALMLNPPLIKKGNFSKTQIKYQPGAIMDLGTDTNAILEPLNLSTSSIEKFPENYGLIKSQILNLNSGGNDNAISASAGDPQTSKTQAGVEANQLRLGVSDNYMRKQFEDWFGEVSETMLNLYMAEYQGTRDLQIDDDTAAKLEKVAPGTVRENTIRVNFDTVTPKMRFQIDASTSSAKDDAAERDRLVELLDLSQKYPMLSQIIGEKGTKELVNRIVVKSGVEDPEKIMPSEEEVDPETGQPKQVQQQMTPEMVQEMIGEAMQQAQDKPKSLSETLSVKLADMPEDARLQAITAILAEMGIEYVPQQQTPLQDESDRKDEEAQLKAIDMAHKHADTLHKQDLSTEQAQNSHMISASDAALRVAQAEDGSSQASNDYQLRVTDQQDRQKQAALTTGGK